MEYDVKKELAHYPNLKGMMDDIPEELRPIFLPEKAAGLFEMEANIMVYKKRSLEREQVMALQKLCGLPFRPNEALNITEAKVRIQGIKNRKLLDRYKKGEE